MMTPPEKLMVQELLVQECMARSTQQPTLLIDALLDGSGPALLHHLLSTRMQAAKQQAKLCENLLWALLDQQTAPGATTSDSAAPAVLEDDDEPAELEAVA